MADRDNRLNVVSLFAGAGGLDIAVCRTGRVGRLFSTDSNEVFLQTLIDNMPIHFPKVRHSHSVADAHELTGNAIRKLLGAKRVDLVMGGPPCDDFTTYGKKRGAQGKKAPLIMEYARLVEELQPQAFLFENVPNLARQFQTFFEKFRDALPGDYTGIKWGVLSAKDYGAPTLRERLFVVGFSSKALSARFQFPPPTHGEPSTQPTLFEPISNLCPFVTVEKVLADLPDVTDPRANKYFNHTGRTHRPGTVEHLKTVPQGIAVRQSYRYRAPWNGLCRSLTAGVDDATKSYVHPLYHREMSVREYARIHGFPDSWAFSGNHHNGIKQVANAVPVLLGTAFLRTVVRTITGGPQQ